MHRDRNVVSRTPLLRICNIIVSRNLRILNRSLLTYLIHLALATDRICYTCARSWFFKL